MSYTAPLKDMLFDIRHLAGIDEIAKMPGFEEAGFETAQAVLEECAKFNEGVVAPLNVEGDRNPSSWKDGKVTTTPGFKEAFRQYAEGGWQGLQHPAGLRRPGPAQDHRRGLRRDAQLGQPELRAVPAAHRRRDRGAADGRLRRAQGHLPGEAGHRQVDRHHEPDRAAGRLATWRWCAPAPSRSPTAPTRSSAPRSSSPTASTTWPRTSCTWCWRACTGAPEGVKGISLFVVPKFMVNKDGSLGARNDVHCVSIEHKLGIKASPTAVLQFGDHGGAVGYLVGQENRGLEYMFIMMNAARYAVGVQGIAVAERAYQQAVAYAKDRVQSRPGGRLDQRQRAHHPPPRRQAHADDDARLHRGLPRDGHAWPRRPTTPRTTTPTPKCASRTRPSTNSWCRWSRATAPR